MEPPSVPCNVTVNATGTVVSRVALDIGSTSQSAGAVSFTNADILGSGTLTGTSFDLYSSNATANLAGNANAQLTSVVLYGNNTFTGNATIDGPTTLANVNALVNATTIYENPSANIILGVSGANVSTSAVSLVCKILP
jgi:hypothetical protein